MRIDPAHRYDNGPNRAREHAADKRLVPLAEKVSGPAASHPGAEGM